MFPRVTHPSATPVLLRAFDLHVLSLPPAFVLSQDQTLKFNLKINPDWSLKSRAPKGPAILIDEFQTHPLRKLPAKARLTAFPTRSFQSAMNCLKRDRRWSLLEKHPRQFPNQPKPIENPTENAPHARTTPPTSLFLPMQLSNSKGPVREPEDLPPSGGALALLRRTGPKLSPTGRSARVKKRPKPLHPASQQVRGSIVPIARWQTRRTTRQRRRLG